MKPTLRRIAYSVLAVLISLAPFSHTSETQAKLYVDNSEGADLTVIDPTNFHMLGAIKVGHKPHGLAASPQEDRLYVSVESTNSLLALDTSTDRIVGKTAVSGRPNQITVTANGKFVYVPLRDAAAVDIVETGSMKVIKHIGLRESPHNAYTSANGQHVYVTTIEGKTIFVFDPASHTIVSEIEPGGKVRPIALTKDESLMYVALSELHGFAVVSISQRKTLRKVMLPPLPPETPRPYLDTYTHGLALTPDERELWVTSCPGAALYAYSVPDLKLRAKVDVGKFPNWLAFTRDGKTLFVSNTESDTVSAIDVLNKKVLATIPVGKAPKRLLVVMPQDAGRL